MDGELLKIGDEVVIAIPQMDLNMGFPAPYPNGTHTKVLGFSETLYGHTGNFGHKPGVYTNPEVVKIETGSKKPVMISCAFLSLVDINEGNRRKEALKNQVAAGGLDRDRHFLRDLPEIPFWEGDIVRVYSHVPLISIISEFPPEMLPDLMMIISVDYDYLGTARDDGSKYPVYTVSEEPQSGWSTMAREDELTLVERGNVWKYYHGEPLQFSDIQEEARFYSWIGQTDEVRNPKNNFYSWTMAEALEAIRSGLGHAIGLYPNFFGSRSSTEVIRFRNEEVGHRVAQVTLQGFAG